MRAYIQGKIIDEKRIKKTFPGRLGILICKRLVDAGLSFPVSRQDVYKYGTRAHCRKCQAMIMIDGTVFRGIYRRQRLLEDPVFDAVQKNKKLLKPVTQV